MATTGAVPIAEFDAVLFDLDGVLTATATIHRECWARTFDDYLARRVSSGGAGFEPFDPVHDYLAHVDGKPRLDGVRDFLASRGIVLDEDEVVAIGETKDGCFAQALAEGRIEVFEGSVAWVRAVRAAGLRTAVVSSSRNCVPVLEAARITDLFDAIVDGRVAEELGLPGKPAPDAFLEGARRVGADPARAVVVEDALAGVAAGRAGGFGLTIGVARNALPEDLRASGADLVVHDLAELL